GGKRLELARELVPNEGVIALLTHPRSPDALEELRELQSDAKAIGQQLLVLSATSEDDLESAFVSMAQHGVRVLLIGQDPFLFQAGGQLVALAAKHRIPAIYGNSELVSAGALISYGASLPRRLAPRRGLRRQNSQRGEAGRLAGRAADQVRTDHQRQNRQDTWPRNSAD